MHGAGSLRNALFVLGGRLMKQLLHCPNFLVFNASPTLGVAELQFLLKPFHPPYPIMLGMDGAPCCLQGWAGAALVPQCQGNCVLQTQAVPRQPAPGQREEVPAAASRPDSADPACQGGSEVLWQREKVGDCQDQAISYIVSMHHTRLIVFY